ncbi:hypothetical protein KAR48_01015 [bacterium]|nr:hypothetical protein [bacterium]
MRIEQNGLSYQPVSRPQRQDAGQAAQFDKIAKAAQAEQAQQTNSVNSVGQLQNTSMSDPVSQPLSKYLSGEEKALLGALFPPSGGIFGISAYQQGQNVGMHSAVRGHNLDLVS